MSMAAYQATSILSQNPYPGRGILMGHTPEGDQAVLAYFIMGRSVNSRNRVFAKKGDDFVIEPFDLSLIQDPSLILYQPIRQLGDKIVLTNGDQTDTIVTTLSQGGTFEGALRTREHEPDAPHFTPRISSIMNLADKGSYTLSLLRAASVKGIGCDRLFFEYAKKPGLGHLIHTYQHDGNPLPSFTGEPLLVSIPQDIISFAGELWKALHQKNRIALYVRSINLNDGVSKVCIFNTHKREGQSNA